MGSISLPPQTTVSKGTASEGLAARYLIEQGYEEITRNFRAKCGEIDLVFFDRYKKELVFVEVRSCFGINQLLKFSLNSAKKMRIRKTICHFQVSSFSNRFRYKPMRVDVIWVNQKIYYPKSIEHWKNIDIS